MASQESAAPVLQYFFIKRKEKVSFLIIVFDIRFPVTGGCFSNDGHKQFGVVLGILEAYQLCNLCQ